MIGLVITVAIIYFLGAIIGLLATELNSKSGDVKSLSLSFYVMAAFLVLVFIAFGLVILFKTSQPVIGVLWLVTLLYIILSATLPTRFKKLLNALVAAIFVVIGAATLLFNIRDTPKIVAVSSFFAGFFLLAFGQFVHCLLENSASKSQSILLYGQFALPIY